MHLIDQSPLMIHIPNELLNIIFHFLNNPSDICTQLLVSKSWSQPLQNPSLWLFYYETQFHETPLQQTDYKHAYKRKCIAERNWMRAKYRDVKLYGHSRGVTCCMFDYENSEKSVWSGSEDSVLIHWDIKTSKWFRMFNRGHQDEILGIVRRGHLLVSCCGSKVQRLNGEIDSVLRIWDYESGKCIHEITNIGSATEFLVIEEFIVCVVWNEILVWDLNGKLVYKFEAHKYPVMFLKKAKGVIITASYTEIKLWDIHSGKNIGMLDMKRDDQQIAWISCTTSATDHGIVATGMLDGNVTVWKTKNTAVIQTLTGIPVVVTAIAINNDASWIAAGYKNGVVIVWKRETLENKWTLARKLTYHKAAITCLKLDYTKLVSGSRDCAVIAVELATGKQLFEIQEFINPVTCLDFDSETLVAGSADATLIVRDFSNESIYRFKNPEGYYKILTPVDKLKKPSTNRKPVVLVLPGAFSPPHKLHIKILSDAREFIEKKGFEVIGAYLSPASDLYNKYGLASFEHRVNMCELVCSKTDWIMVDKWELSQKTFQLHHNVLDHVRQVVNKIYQNVQVMLVCGADLLQGSSMHHVLEVGGVICARRSNVNIDYNQYAQKLLEHYKDKVFILDKNSSEEEVSSSLIRSKIQKNQPIDNLTFTEVADYISKNKLFC